MGLWSFDLVRVDGSLRVYTRVQNEFTGTITDGIRDIFMDKDGRKYFRADHRTYDITDKIKAFTAHEAEIEKALEFYRKNYNSFTRG